MSEATDAVVRVKFAVAGEPAHEYVASSSDAEALSFNAADGAGDAYSYAYTGKHDDGELPTLREGGHYAHLARAMLKAKARAAREAARRARASHLITRARGARARAWHRRRATAS